MEFRNKEAGSAALQTAFVLGAFALGTSENVIAGMLPQLSASLGITIAQAGLLITAYAGTAVAAGPLLAILTSAMRPFGLTVVVVAFYTAGSLLAAFAPTFGILMAARILTGAMHTTILVMFILAAMETAAPDRKARHRTYYTWAGGCYGRRGSDWNRSGADPWMAGIVPCDLNTDRQRSCPDPLCVSSTGCAEIHRLRIAARAATSGRERWHCDERARRPGCADSTCLHRADA